MSQLDIIIPVYNEGDNIFNVLNALGRWVKTPFRVLICYDEETDNTLPAVRSYKAKFPLELVKNQGRGVHAAVIAGFKKSTAPAVLVMPADDDYNGAIIDGMYQKFEGGCDIVAASRFMKGGCMKGCPFPKSVLVRAAAFTLYHLGGLPVHDATNGFRLFSRRVLTGIQVESTLGWVFSLELLVKVHRLGWKITQVPAGWFERKKGRSRFQIMKWLPAYLEWYFYGFATTYLRKAKESVKLKVL